MSVGLLSVARRYVGTHFWIAKFQTTSGFGAAQASFHLGAAIINCGNSTFITPNKE